MRRIKFSVNDIIDYPVDITVYEEFTHNDKPYVHVKDGRINHYAICPKCNNPAIILGLYKRIDGVSPHARHTRYDVDGLAIHEDYYYEWCPNHRKNVEYVCEPRRDERTSFEINIYNAAREYFAQSILCIQSAIGIYISDNLAKDIGRNYALVGADMYRGACIENIPCMMIFAYHGFSLYKKLIAVNNPMIPFLESCKNVRLKDYNDNYYLVDKNSEYLDLDMNISLCESTVQNDETVYYLTVVIGKPTDNGYFETLWKKKLVVDVSGFVEAINNQKNDTYRKKLSEIGLKTIPELT